MYYNEGLERAQVRNLSGAAESLRKSLRYDKRNTQARNLLGLIYFEMGETVDALSEWVISKSLCPEDNRAEEYLASVQSNGNKLEAMNQTIKKYNQALIYCHQESKDLAVIQLKKVLSMNPRLVKGHQLLALLYLEEGKYELARKSLRNAGRIDADNTVTHRYLQEVNKHIHGEEPSEKRSRKAKEELVAYQSGNETIIHPAKFKDNSAIATILNIVVGVGMGVLLTWFLIVPTVKQSMVSDTNKAVREANDTVSNKNQTIKTLEGQIGDLEGKIKELEDAGDDNVAVVEVYQKLLTAYDAYVQEDVEGAVSALELVDDKVLSGKASEIYQNLSDKVDEQYIVVVYQKGKAAYDAQNFAEAAVKLQKVVNIDETYEDCYALYYLAQSYRQLGDNEKAATYYQKMVELRPGTERARKSEEILGQIQQTTGQP